MIVISAFAGCNVDRVPSATASPELSPVMVITPKPTERETAAPETEPPYAETPDATEAPEKTDDPAKPTERPAEPTERPTERPT
ncbi:MAG: hypothetical protein II184_05110, partial [Clostridia bacterium]|nr:hypothetical protein [Clostridia bacterium]